MAANQTDGQTWYTGTKESLCIPATIVKCVEAENQPGTDGVKEILHNKSAISIKH